MVLLLLPSVLHLLWSVEESLSVLNEMKSCQVNKTSCKDGKTWNHLTGKEKKKDSANDVEQTLGLSSMMGSGFRQGSENRPQEFLG